MTTTTNDAATVRVMVRKDKTNPRRLAYVTLVLFATPPGLPLLIISALMVLAAVFLHGWAAGYLARAGYQDREKLLTARGPYRHNRNPYYLAHIVMDLGFFLMAGLPWLYLFYIPISFSVYRRWVMNEEPFLEEEFGEEYRQFKRDVPRWGFRLTPAEGRGHEQKFEWALYMRNHELHRTVSHLLLLGVFIAFVFTGNPFAELTVVGRITIIAAFAVWLFLHDIFLVDETQVSPLWLILGTLLLVGLIIFLAYAPLWQVWTGPAAWLAVSVGMLLGLYAAFTSSPFYTRITGKPGAEAFARPMNYWYVIGIGLGLLTCTLGGVWLGIGIPLIIWTFGIAGVAPMKTLPQHNVTAGGLVLVFAISLGTVLQRLLL